MIPKRLRMKNFLSHDASEIDFGKFDVALILGSYDGEADQSNGAGKSAIFEAITWALFDKSRHKKKDGVVKWDCRSCEVVFEFIVDDITYKVFRTRDKTVGESDVTFEQWNGEKQDFDDISCDNSTLTNDKIVATIGFNYEVFANSVYFKQDDISMFAAISAGKRKDVIKSLLRMDQWDDYQKRAKTNASVLQSKIEEKSQKLVPLDIIKKNIEENGSQLAVIKKQIKEVNQEYSIFNSSFIEKKLLYHAKYGNLANDECELKRLQKESNDSKKRLVDIRTKKEENNKNIKTNSDQLFSLQQKIIAFKIKIQEGRGVDLAEYRNKIVTGKTKEKLLKEKILELEKEISLNNGCDLCGKPLTKKEIDDIRNKRIQELTMIKEQYTEIQQKLSRADEKLKQKDFAVSDSIKAELEKSKIETRIAKTQSFIEECSSENNRMAEEQKILEAKDFKEDLSILREKFNKEEEGKLKAEIQSLEKSVHDSKKRLDKINIEYGSKANSRDELLKAEKEQGELQKEINKLKDEFSVYDKLKEYFGKDGIQAVIIENVIEELENYSNDTLSKICNEPTSISIATQKQSENGSWAETFDINIKEGIRTDEFETLSGGEKFRVSLALRLALSNILSRRMGGTVKFLLLDEISSSLDKKGLDMFIGVVKQLGIEMKILVITHDERLKEKFTDIIIVNKTQAGSKIVCQ